MLPGNFVTDSYPPEQVWFHRDMGGKVDLYRWYHIHYEEIAIRVFRELSNLMKHLRTDGVLERITCPALSSGIWLLSAAIVQIFSSRPVSIALTLPLHYGAHQLHREKALQPR